MISATNTRKKKGGSKTRTGEVLRRLFADLPVAALL
jgi:hypothetical protein